MAIEVRGCASSTANTPAVVTASTCRSPAASASPSSVRTARARRRRWRSWKGSGAATPATSASSDRDPAHADRAWRSRIGVVGQAVGAPLNLSVREAVRHFAIYHARPRADRRAARRGRADRQGRHPHSRPVRRAAPPPRRGPRRAGPPGVAVPRRADDRARPGGPPAVLDAHRGAPGGGDDDPAHDALPGRGGPARRPRCRDRVRAGCWRPRRRPTSAPRCACRRSCAGTRTESFGRNRRTRRPKPSARCWPGTRPGRSPALPSIGRRSRTSTWRCSNRRR